MAEQLIKKTEEGYSNVMPKSWIEAITDKSTGESLTHILQGFNMYFLSYTGNTEQTRCQVSKILRKKGLWITYVKYDGNVYTEWYNSNDIDDKSWGNSSNWRVGNNELVGDLTISANGNWVINGNETEFKAIGEKGNTPLIRIADNKLQVSYDRGDTYNNVSDNPVYTQIRIYNNKLQISTDLGANWVDASDEIAAYFRFNSGQGNNVGNIQISRNNKDWSDLSGNFVNNLHISKYIGADETLPTSGVAEGTIYAKGPTYAYSDTSHSNPIYRLWVYAYKGDTLAWQDNGEFTSINAGITQELGNSENLVVSQKCVSQEIIQGGVYDVSAHNNDAVFESLQALLSSSNLSTLIPPLVRHGGMSIKFIQGSEQSSDNKYVQYRLISASWSTNMDDWVEGGGSGDGAYDISANNNNATYDNLTAALGTNGANIPQYMHKGGLSVKFLENIYALYDVVKTDYGTTPSSDEQTIINSATDIEAALPISDGSYNANEITNNYTGSDKSTIDSAIEELLLVGSVTYHAVVVVDGEDHDIVWSITKVTDDTLKYVKYTLVADDWSNNINNWENDSELCDEDKIIKNRPLLNKYLVKGVDFEQFDGAYINAQGVITQESSNSYIKIPISKFRGNFVYISEISLNTSSYSTGYGVYDAEDNILSSSYYGGNRNLKINKSTNASASYMLFSVGETHLFNGIVVFDLTYNPLEVYDVSSLNASKLIASKIQGVSNDVLSWLKEDIVYKFNKFDKSNILEGVAVLEWSSATKIDEALGYKMYFCEVPKDATVIGVRNICGKGSYDYFGIAVVDENLTILQKNSKFGSIPNEVVITLNSYVGKRYFAFNVEGKTVGGNVDNIIVYFEKQPQYATRDADYFDINRVNKPLLNLHQTDSQPHNYIEDGVFTSSNNNNITIDVPVNGGDYITYYLPDALYQINSDTFVQYDENNEIIKSEQFIYASSLNFGKNNLIFKQKRLESACRRIVIKPNLGLTPFNIAQLVERGNRIYINHNRQMYWGGKRVSDIYGISLPVVTKDALEGKTICCMGDSITDFGSSTANGSYAWQIQLQHNCAVINYGRGNAHFCDVAGTDPTADTNPGIGKTSTPEGYNNVVSTQVRWCIREMQEDNVTPDVFILSGCTNDAFTAPHLGSLEDALAAYPMTEDVVHTDFYPCAVYMVSKIRAAFPNAKIYFATPIRSLNTGQMVYLQTYVEAFRTIADALGIEIIDWFKESGIIQYPAGTSGESTFTHSNPWFNKGDSIHPSQLGVNAMAKLAVSKMISSFAQNM